MKQSVLVIALMVLAACGSDPQRDLVITFEDIRGLHEGDYVILNKQNVGEVTGIEFNDNYQMDVRIHLDKIKRLPKDSRFMIGRGGLFDDAVYVVPGKSKQYLTSSDRVMGKSVKEADLGKMINDFFEQVTPKPKEDSVLMELRDIKEEIHEANEKKH